MDIMNKMKSKETVKGISHVLSLNIASIINYNCVVNVSITLTKININSSLFDTINSY